MKEECKEKGEKGKGKMGGGSGRVCKPQTREPLRTLGAVIQWIKGDGT